MDTMTPTALEDVSATTQMAEQNAPPRGTWVTDDDGVPVCVCSVVVDVIGIEHDPERDRFWYVAFLGEPISKEVRSPAQEGGRGLARAIAASGAWVRPRELARYLDGVISEKWGTLYANRRTYRGPEDGADPEAISVYEKFTEWISINQTQFDSGNWGLVEEAESVRKVWVWAGALARFFAEVRVYDEKERRAVLRYWKEAGWLETKSGKYSTVKWDPVSCRLRRAYVVVCPRGQAAEAEQAEGEN